MSRSMRPAARTPVVVGTAIGGWAVALAVLSGCASIDAPDERPLAATAIASATAPSASVPAMPAPEMPFPTPVVSGSALRALDQLRVAGRGPMTGYSRSAFGPTWSDVDRNGCDTRNDILKRDLTDLVFKPGTRDCAVSSGTLEDRYTATTIRFVRGGVSEVDIDHVVALGNAWVTGAARLTDVQRLHLANDPYNLLAVDASANRQKRDGDAATWLPSNKAYRCQYVARQIGVKVKYDLYVTPAEKAAMRTVLALCVGQPLPES